MRIISAWNGLSLEEEEEECWTDRGGKLYRMFGSENICGNLFQGCVLVFRRLDEWLNGFFRKVLGFDV